MKGVGSVAQAMLEVRVLTSEPPSRVRLLLLIKYKEGVVNKSYFGTLESAGSNPVPARVAQLEEHSA